MLNAGGDIVCGDRKPEGGDWIIGVQHPRKKGEIYRTVKLSNTCIVTSGDYERFFMHDSMRYHHIFDPRTGYPAQGIISASVVCNDIVRADVVSTTLVVGGKDKVKKGWLGVEQVLLLDDDMAEVNFSHTETQKRRDMD
jgi:thiamine biosynthesis lipoprotein